VRPANLGYTLGLFAAVAMLFGCGGSQPPIGAPGAMPQTVTKSARDAHSGPLLYVSNDGDQHDVTVYPADAKDPGPIETISSGLEFPSGICLDGRGTLYVVDQDGWVAEYPAGKTKPSKIITKGIDVPIFCAIDSKGNLWVTNAYGPNVTEYLKGSTKPHTVITKGLTYPDGIAIDHAGNIYIGNPLPSSSPTIQVFAPGSKSPSRTITDGVDYPIGMTVDAHGTLYVTSDRENNVEEYRFGQDHPYQTITDDMDGPAAVTVNKNGYLYVTNAENFEVVEFAPGSITPSERQISKGLLDPFGTAYSPPLLPRSDARYGARSKANEAFGS
jgi:hypothetical protein